MISTDQVWEPTREGGLALLEELSAHKSKELSAQCLSLLGLRLIRPLELLTILSAPASQGLESSCKETLMWRLYCNGWLENHPQIWMTWRRLVSASQPGWQQREEYLAALESRTGIEIFDKWMTQLAETGVLSAQQAKCFASLWIYSLKLPWSLGADLHCKHSSDFNLAVHLLNWRMVAGLQVKNEHFSVTAAELVETFGEFEGQDQVLVSALPPTFPSPPKLAHSTDYPTLPGEALGEDYALLITPEDLYLEDLAEKLPSPRGVVFLDSSFGRERGEVSKNLLDRAVAKASQQAKTLFDCSVMVISDSGEELPEQLKFVLSDSPAKSLAYHQPRVGEWQEKLLDLARKDVGFRYFPLRRDWEAKCFSLATKSFKSFENLASKALNDAASTASG